MCSSCNWMCGEIGVFFSFIFYILKIQKPRNTVNLIQRSRKEIFPTTGNHLWQIRRPEISLRTVKRIKDTVMRTHTRAHTCICSVWKSSNNHWGGDDAIQHSWTRLAFERTDAGCLIFGLNHLSLSPRIRRHHPQNRLIAWPSFQRFAFSVLGDAAHVNPTTVS